MKKIETYKESIFDRIKHFDEYHNEYWEARELMIVLQYSNWQNFDKIVDKAKISCEKSHISIVDHFINVDKMVEIGSNTSRKIVDYKLSRYACYLIVQNADPRKEVVALGQTYFAIQTRKQELSEKDYNELTEDEKRIYQRNLTKKGNYSLNQTAKSSGVKNFDRFHNAGYKGLYNGETANDIAKRKKLRYREDILDYMGSEELVDNLFRITHTEQKLKREQIQGEKEANMMHYNMGKDIRKFIEKQGGTMPEKLSTPQKSFKELEKKRRKRKSHHLASTINLIAVLSSPSIVISVNAGMQTKFLPLGATKPRATAMALIA